MEELHEKVDEGDVLEFHEFDELVELSDDPERAEYGHEIMMAHTENIETVGPLDAVNLIQARDLAEEYELETNQFERMLEDYVSEVDIREDMLEMHRLTLPQGMEVDDVLSAVDHLYERYSDDENRLDEELREYILIIKDEVNLI